MIRIFMQNVNFNKIVHVFCSVYSQLLPFSAIRSSAVATSLKKCKVKPQGTRFGPWGFATSSSCRAEDKKHYFLNEIPKIDEFLGKTQFLSQTKYLRILSSGKTYSARIPLFQSRILLRCCIVTQLTTRGDDVIKGIFRDSYPLFTLFTSSFRARHGNFSNYNFTPGKRDLRNSL